MRLADYVIEYFVNKEIKNAQVITGRGSLFLNDALAKNKNLQLIFPHHEQSAAFAAVAAATLTNEPQLVVVSTGCASTNTITGVLSAWQDELPIIFVSGQNTLGETTNYTGRKIRTFGQQEADIVPIVSTITKYSIMIDDPNKVKIYLDTAFHETTSGVKGPVWLDIPIDIQNAQIDPLKLEGTTFNDTVRYGYANNTVEGLVNDFQKAERPVILIGSGVAKSKASLLVKKLSEENDIPIVYTHSAVDAVPFEFPNSIGSFGSQGCHRSGAFAVQNSDFLLVLGSKLNSLTIGPDPHLFAREAKIYIVDINKDVHDKKRSSNYHILTYDIYTFIQSTFSHKLTPKKKRTEWLILCQKWKFMLNRNDTFVNSKNEIDLYYLANITPNVMPPDGILICDSGFVDVIIPTNAPFKMNQNCIRPISQGAMGFALPACVGVGKSTNRQIFCIVGDGSFMFNLQELETIKRYDVNVKILVINNGMYSVIRRRQKQLFRNRIVGVGEESGLVTSDIRKIAQAFSIHYEFAEPEDLHDILKDLFNRKGPVIIEVKGKIEQEYIEIGYKRVNPKQLKRMPIEDQKPFLDEELFKTNMIIKTVN